MKALGRSLLLLALALAGLAPAAVPDVLFVAGSTAPPAPDPFIVARISAMGFNPVIVDDNAVTLADAAGKAFIFISESCVSATLTTLFRDVTIPVICSEANLYDDMQMTGPTAGTYYGNTPLQTSLYIRDPSHYLADGYSNTVIVFSPSRDLYWGVPAPSASVIAVMPATPSQACIFAYEPGQPMNGGFPAPARRLGFYLGPLAADAMTATGRNLLDRALLWAAGAAAATPTWTPTSTPSGTPTWSPTSTPTGTPTSTASDTPTPSPSDTETTTGTATPSATGTDSPTWTPTDSPTSTQTPTGTPTPTPTVTLTASPTPLPPIVMQLLVFDSEQRLVKDLGSTYSYLPAPSLSAAPDPYAPEDGSLTATAGAFLWNWAGDRADGKGVPNGQYQFVLKQTGAGDVKAHVWLEHKAASLGAAVFYPNPAQKGTVNLSLQAKAGVSTELLLYSIAGELVLQKRFGPLLTLALIELRSPSGQALAPGIYLARIRLSAQGGVEQVLERKLAVTR